MTLAPNIVNGYVQQYAPYIDRTARQYHYNHAKDNPVIDFEDLKQEGLVWFFETAKSQGLDAALSHRRSLCRVMYDSVRKSYPIYIPHWAFRGDRDISFVSIDENWESVYDALTMKVEDAVEGEVYAQYLLSQLSEEEKEVVKMRMEGRTIREIAGIMNVTRSRIEKVIANIRTLIGSLIEND